MKESKDDDGGDIIHKTDDIYADKKYYQKKTTALE